MSKVERDAQAVLQKSPENEGARKKRAEHEAKQLERAQAKLKKADADSKKEETAQRAEAEKLVLIGSPRRKNNAAEGAATDTAAVDTIP